LAKTDEFAKIREYVEEDLLHAEETIFELLRTENKTLGQSTLHLVKAGGKRIRPLLVLLCGRIYGELDERFHHLAACVELIHLSTLIHDDVVDNASLRRGSPSVNSIWGNKISVLSGDFIYSRVFLSLVNKINNMQVLRALSRAAQLMSIGEIMQIENTGNIELSEPEYFQVVERKTAVFLSACCECAAILAQAPAEDVLVLRDYGNDLGYAFQIVDDTLDFVARTDHFGKTSFKDLEEGKITLPVIHLLANSDGQVRQAVKNVMHGLSEDSADTIRQALRASGSLLYAQKRAMDFSERAINNISAIADGRAVQSLKELCRWLVKRDW
jgi:octaprenyl-diphosphate synthase